MSKICLKRIFVSVILLCVTVFYGNAQYNVDKLVLSGRIALHYEDYVLSIQYFNQAINQKPYLWEPWQLRAISKFYLEDWKGCETDASKAIELNPYIVSLYDLRGLSYIRQGRYGDAITDYSKAISIESGNQNFWYNRAVCYVELKDYEHALLQLDTITSKWNNYAPAYLMMAEVYLQQKDTLQAVVKCNKAIDIDKHNGDAWRMNAFILFSQEQWKEAETAFDKALLYKPKDVGCYINRALCRLKQNKLRGTMEDYDTAIDLAPNNFLAHYNRGLLRAQVGDDNRAIEDFNFVLSLEPYNVMALFNRATLLDRTGNLREAIRDYSLVIDKFPNFWTGLSYRASCYRRLGMIAKAEKDEFRILSAQMDKHLGKQPRWSRQKLTAMRKYNDIDLEKYNQLVIDDSQLTEHEYKSEYRGKVQNLQIEKQFQPYIALSVNSKQMEISRYAPFDVKIDEYLNSIKTTVDKKELSMPRLSGLGEGTGSATFTDISLITEELQRETDNQKTTDLLLLRSIAYSSAQNFHDALKDLETVIEKEGNNVVALWQKTVCMAMIAEYEQKTSSGQNVSIMRLGCQSEYDALHKLTPDNALVYYNEGTYYARNGNYESAIEKLSKSLLLDDRLPFAYYNRGLAYLYLGKNDKARADFGKAGELGLYSAYSIMKNGINEKK